MPKIRKFFTIFAIFYFQFKFGLASSNLSNDDDDDYLSQKEHVLENSYHGLIRENETFVEITPLIKVNEEKICDFRILTKPHHNVPFQIQLVNNLGILKARTNLNCEKRKSYHFAIVAVFCDGTHSASANVHISVIDINEYAPTFLQPSYVTEVDEGRLFQEIIRVEAIDKDCTPLFGDVCKYEILNNDQPFTIDNEGSIKNTEPLSHKASHNHILSVVGYDCAMKRSAPIMVSIKVRRVCEARLTGIPERIDYTANSLESLSLFPNINLELCDMHCNDEDMNIHASVVLKTKHISFGCDRDITQCSIESLIDLLPKGAEWTKDLRYDEGTEPVFHFDGVLGAIVPETIVPRHDFASHSFSIVTMFKHISPPSASKHIKEHIICSADDHKMNRHHMALFVRNCRLIMLLRKNFNEGDLNIFSPAEWRWKIPQVCDNEWHQYVINLDLPKVELYIDGVKFESSAEDRHSNPEVIDDWPLHAAHGVNTTLTIGSCYQGSENHYRHGFNGDISEIKISMNNVLSVDDVKCGTSCAERLVPPSEKFLESEQQVQSNAQLNEIYIDGTNKSNIETLLQNIHYINSKQKPTIGRRNIEVRTTLMCINQSAVRLPTVETYIMVSDPTPTKALGLGGGTMKNGMSQKSQSNIKATNTEYKSKIIISGNPNHLVSYPEIKKGVYILGNISIIVFTGGEFPQNLQTLDACTVSVFPSLNPDHEEIELDGDDSLSSTLNIKTNINKDGVEMIGYDTIVNYLDVLKALVYTNKKPAYYLNRVFKLSCSQMNSRFHCAEFTVTLTVLHPKLTVTTSTANPNVIIQQQQHGKLQMQQKHDSNLFSNAMVHSHDVQESRPRIHSILHEAQNSHPTMLIIVICVFFVILLCGVSFARLRNNNTKFMERHQPCPKIASESLDWDDSALTITINPMQNDVVSEDSSDSENSDSEDEEVSATVVNGKYKNVSQLEWDNTTM